MNVLLTLHNLVRWLVAIIAVIVLVKYVAGWLGKSKFTDLDVTLGRAFSGAMTVQFLLGIFTLISYIAAGAFNPRTQIEHAVYGVVATALSHMTGMFRKQDDATRFRNSALLVLLALLVVFLSVTRLRGSFFGI
jgi:hypothetical protein